MSLNWPKPSHNHAAEFQVSGWPFVTSSVANEVGATPVSITFPYVTSWVQVFNTDPAGADTLRVGFTQNGVLATTGNKYLILSGGQTTAKLDVKCTNLWFMKHGSNATSFSIIAGLTNVTPSDFPAITGSSGFDGVG